MGMAVRPISRSATTGRRGQSLVEFALVVPVFLSLLFGALELGMLYKTRAAFQEAAQQAVRVDAAAGNATSADAQALAQLQSTLPDENLTAITTVTIFKATASGVPVTPPASTDYSYSVAQKAFVCKTANTPSTAPQGQPCNGEPYWDPLTRNTQAGGASPLDYIGIKISYDYRSVTGLLPLMHFTQTATAMIEPDTYAP